MGPGSPQRGGGWSDWVWDENQRRYWRARLDAQGNYEYEVDNATAPQPAAPRSNVDDLAQSLSSVNLGGQDAQYTQGGAYVYGALASAGASGPAGVYGTPSAIPLAGPSTRDKGKSAERSARHKPRGHKEFKSSSSKGHRSKNDRSYSKGYAEDPVEYPPFYPGPGPAAGSDYASVSGADLPSDHTPLAYTHDPPPHDSAYTSGVPHVPDAEHGFSQGATTRRDAEDAATEIEASSIGPAEHAGHDYASSTGISNLPEERVTSSYYSTASSVAPGEPSDQLQEALSEADAYLTGAPAASFENEDSSSTATTHTYPEPFEADDGRAMTPRPFVHQQAPTTAPDDYPYQSEAAQSLARGPRGPANGYAVEPSSRFRPGEVFKILWCEPMGAGGTVITQRERVERNGQPFYQGYRRFIVIANDEGHCTCVPILTYERQACKKRGVKPHKHGIVYEIGRKPKKLDQEPPLGFDPIRVDLYERTERLVKESRVNYAKLTTVEHNFLVFFIGRVVDEDFNNIVRPAVDYCWERKRRHLH